MVMPPMRTISNLPFSKIRTSSGDSKRFKTISSIPASAGASFDAPPRPEVPGEPLCRGHARLNRATDAQFAHARLQGGPLHAEHFRRPARSGHAPLRLTQSTKDV